MQLISLSTTRRLSSMDFSGAAWNQLHEYFIVQVLFISRTVHFPEILSALQLHTGLCSALFCPIWDNVVLLNLQDLVELAEYLKNCGSSCRVRQRPETKMLSVGEGKSNI